ncbi:hypothetical protein HZC34_01240 [Candidatus Saganbacteria bacterium]|nr:hypothetical protein [Candidatus Saganbacteria bacterium]
MDHGVGAADLALVGARVEEGGLLAVIYANSVGSARIAESRIRNAYTIGDEQIIPPELINKIIL